MPWWQPHRVWHQFLVWRAMTDRYEKIRKALAMGPTPGPWEVTNGTDVFTQLGARNAAGVESAANDGWHISDCDMGPYFTEEGEADIPYVEKRANAALIASCDPDTIQALLDERDALREALEMVVEMIEMDGFVWDYAMDVARRLLAKENSDD